MMRGLSSLPLDDDITDRILCFLPTFAALQATIVASRSFYTVFKAHPNSVLRAVAYNVTGPALPQALRVIRYHNLVPDSGAKSDIPSTPYPEAATISPISSEETRNLTRNASVVGALEDLFSWRHKDRTSNTSKLSSMESWRFRRAMYRFMLFSQVFPGHENENEDDEDLDEEDEEEINQTKQDLKRFLGEFFTEELLELQSVVAFLHDLSEWTARAESIALDASRYAEIALSAGPAEILQAYQDVSTQTVQNNFTNDLDGITHDVSGYYLRNTLSEICEDRKVLPPKEDSCHWKTILDEVKGENDECHKCGVSKGMDLWNETNWDFLKGVMSTCPFSLPGLLKGSLPLNAVERYPLATELAKQNFSYSTLIHELFDIATHPYDSWDKRDWICEACLAELIRSHLHLWWLECKRNDGQPISEDCWYGYNCRTQTHKRYHALRLNHLCEPTR